MDEIAKISADKLSADKNQRRFLTDVNQEIDNLNKLIEKYNNPSLPNKKELLLEIYHYQKKIIDKYPDNIVSYFPQFNELLNKKLFQELQSEFRKMGLNSLSKSAIEHFELSIPQSNTTMTKNNKADGGTLAELIADMHPDKVSKLAKILTEEDRAAKIEEIKNLYGDESSSEAKKYRDFMAHQEISSLGSGNSHVFKIKDQRTEQELVLKVEDHVGNPTSFAALLTSTDLSGKFTTVFSERQTFLANDNKTGKPAALIDGNPDVLVRRMVVTEFSEQGNLKAVREKISSDEDVLKSAASIYRQVAGNIEEMRLHDVIFLDQKNTNIMLDKNGQFRISDTKSLMSTTYGRLDSKDSVNANNSWFIYGAVYSEHMKPPRTSLARENADEINAFQLGYNLYQFLTNCTDEELFEVNNHPDVEKKHKLNFDHPIFETEEGKEYREMIEKLTKVESGERMAVAEALDKLIKLDNKLNPKEKIEETEKIKQRNSCLEWVDKITQHESDKNMEVYRFEKIRKIYSCTTIKELAEIHKSLQTNFIALETDALKKECKDLVIKIESNVKERGIAGYLIRMTNRINESLEKKDVEKIKEGLQNVVNFPMEMKKFEQDIRRTYGSNKAVEIKKKMANINIEDRASVISDYNKARRLVKELQSNIKHYQFGNDDKKMKTYLEMTQEKINTALTSDPIKIAILKNTQKELQILADSLGEVKKFKQNKANSLKTDQIAKLDPLERANYIVTNAEKKSTETQTNSPLFKARNSARRLSDSFKSLIGISGDKDKAKDASNSMKERLHDMEIPKESSDDKNESTSANRKGLG